MQGQAVESRGGNKHGKHVVCRGNKAVFKDLEKLGGNILILRPPGGLPGGVYDDA